MGKLGNTLNDFVYSTHFYDPQFRKYSRNFNRRKKLFFVKGMFNKSNIKRKKSCLKLKNR